MSDQAHLITFGLWIRQTRKAAGYSQRSLADKVGTGYPYISKIEADRELPSIALLAKIAQALDVPFADVVEKSGRCTSCGSIPDRDFAHYDPKETKDDRD